LPVLCSYALSLIGWNSYLHHVWILWTLVNYYFVVLSSVHSTSLHTFIFTSLAGLCSHQNHRLRQPVICFLFLLFRCAPAAAVAATGCPAEGAEQSTAEPSDSMLICFRATAKLIIKSTIRHQRLHLQKYKTAAGHNVKH